MSKMSLITQDGPHPAEQSRWSQLAPELELRVASFLCPNDISCTIRLLNRAAAALFSSPSHKIVRLSQPVPHHAFSWRWATSGATYSLTLQQRQQLVILTATTGSVPNLAIAVAAAGLVSAANVITAAAAAGQLDACEWLKARGYPLFSCLEAAARSGNVSMCEWALACGCPWRDAVFKIAAKGGDPWFIEWLLTRRPAGLAFPYRSSFLPALARGCRQQALQRISRIYLNCESGKDGERRRGCDDGYADDGDRDDGGRDDGGDSPAAILARMQGMLKAAAGSQCEDWKETFLWLEALGCPSDGNNGSSVTAAAAGVLPDAEDRLRWLHERGYNCNLNTAVEAVRKGNVSALSYLLMEGGLKLNDEDSDVEHLATTAASRGHLEMLQLLHCHECPMDMEALRGAARGGFLDVVRWLVDEPGVYTPLDAVLMENAAYSPSLELLMWLRSRGCPWDAAVLNAAASTGRMDKVKWLIEEGCPRHDDIIASAARGGCMEMLEWLVQGQGYPFVSGWPYHAAGCQGDFAILECLRRLGCPWSGRGMTRSSLFYDCLGSHSTPCAPIEVLQWLHDAGCPVCWMDAWNTICYQQGPDKEEVKTWVWGWLYETLREAARGKWRGARGG
ncbi:hypothetical protein VaNZ11_013236 [Volvox africanus]|uniref:F-box domain-containing protein n=1 Tax=Volvox africanus TaxID=51714 RepID=A0ABQ5SFN2_9CHLO|nr:hypothetical protein VaNZ11_013236 [Volvox africanus]